MQVAHGSETGASFDNHGQTRDQSQPIPQATPAPVPTRAMVVMCFESHFSAKGYISTVYIKLLHICELLVIVCL